MSQKSLSHLSDEATQETNTTGITTPILTISPEDGVMFRLINGVSSGDALGIPVYADLRDGSDNPLPTDTKLVLRAFRPTDDEPVTVSVAESNIAPWNSLTTAEQRNEENIDQIKLELQGSAVNVRDKDTLRVEVESSKAIDWTNSELYFAREAVRQQPFEG